MMLEREKMSKNGKKMPYNGNNYLYKFYLKPLSCFGVYIKLDSLVWLSLCPLLQVKLLIGVSSSS